MEKLKITKVYIKKLNKEGNSKLVGIGSILLNDCFKIDKIRIIDSKKDRGLFVAMPSFKDKENKYHDICYPIDFKTRKYFEEVIIGAYLNTSEEDNDWQDIEIITSPWIIIISYVSYVGLKEEIC